VAGNLQVAVVGNHQAVVVGNLQVAVVGNLLAAVEGNPQAAVVDMLLVAEGDSHQLAVDNLGPIVEDKQDNPGKYKNRKLDGQANQTATNIASWIMCIDVFIICFTKAYNNTCTAQCHTCRTA